MRVRRPYVAGSFYPATQEALRRAIYEAFKHPLGPGRTPERTVEERQTVSVVCPHAGYIYSGPVAAHSYYILGCEAKPTSIIIIGPNHTGLGSPISIMAEGAWRTPLGDVEIDEELAGAILRSSEMIDVDEMAHSREHSIEVQLPFLQYIYGEFRFVPISMGLQDLDSSREVGRAIGEASYNRDAVIVASTDLTHYEPQASAKRKDMMVIESILSLDEASLQEGVYRNRISMCGYGPVSASIVASKAAGSRRAELLAYHTSGDVTGDYSAVVGYASIRLLR